MNPLLLVDSYKVHHTKMYPDGMTLLYSNFTPRKSRIPGIDKVVVFGLQHFMKEYLMKKFNEDFFNRPLAEVINEYKFAIDVDTTHIKALHKLGYLPLEIKALAEGTKCPIGVPLLTIYNTRPDIPHVFGWLVNYLETLISCQLWQPITSATIANEYYKLLSAYAIETTGNNEGVQWQGHDFSMRGMSSVESAILSAMGHLITGFTGTDTIPAIYALRNSYNTKDGELIGASVPATEHSVMCMGQKESEIDTFKRLLNLYPSGILSVVSDTWNLWTVLTDYLPKLKEEILARDGKLVIRPDSGDPVNIICGFKIVEGNISDLFNNEDVEYNYSEYVWKNEGKYYLIDKEWDYEIPYAAVIKEISLPETKGVIELLWDTFGGTINEKGYRVLDSHIGAIYGDSITLERAKAICDRLKAKGFASTNIVFGIGSYTYQYNTRDTFGFAMKATYGEVTHPHEMGDIVECREIFKDPITDDGTKKSKKGLLAVHRNDDNDIFCIDKCTWEQESKGLLETVFLNGKIVKETTLEEIRNRLK